MHNSIESPERRIPLSFECGRKEEQSENALLAQFVTFVRPYPPAQPGGAAAGCQAGKRVPRAKEG